MDNDKRIFISYGHNNFDLLASKLANDLRNNGFEVFLDTDYLKLGDWEEIIDRHLKSCKWMIYLISERSVSTSSYCLNELCRAGELNLSIIPISLDDSLAPLSINRLQRIFMQKCVGKDKEIITEFYEQELKNLLDIVNGKISLGFVNNDDIRLKNCLKPINNNYDIYNHYLNFCGRHELFKTFEEWLEMENSPILWLKGTPGVGKTAFSSALCWKYPQTVKGVHFCKFNNSDRTDPKKIITSLVYQLATALPEYKEYLQNLGDLEKIYDKNASRIFEYLLIEPLSTIRINEKKVLVIDALDECTWGEENEIGNILMRYHKFLPNWLKIFITARNEDEIKRTLSQFYVIDPMVDNDEDLREFFIKQLPENTQINIIDRLVQKSEGSFLYATEICKEIKKGRLSVDDIEGFPNGIFGYFTDCFDRLFATNESGKNISYEEIKPLLELLTISQEPITIEIAMDYLNCDEYTVRKMVSKIISFFPLDSNSLIRTLHKSITDWLLNYNYSNRYYISKREANNKLLKYMLKIYDQRVDLNNVFVLKRLTSTLMELNNVEKLIETIKDKDFQLRRFKLLHLDGGLSAYLNELSYVYNNKQEEMTAIFSDDAFIDIFSKYRRVLYNWGLFFNLKKLGFTMFLSNCKIDFNLEFEIGTVFYYYIVEVFDKAIKSCNKLINNATQYNIDKASLAEIYNILGLSCRKLVKFEEGIIAFQNAIECGEEVEYNFEISMAHLLTSKIKCRMLKPLEARRESRKAISKLQDLIDSLPDGDEKIGNALFMAEEKRVFADNLIWDKKFEQAKECLDECLQIYTTHKRTDRYYVRYKYTSLFLEIMSNPSLSLDEQLLVVQNQIKQGKYDLGQISFLRSLNFYLSAQNEQDKKKGLNLALKAIEYYEDINATLENAEAGLIYNLLCNDLGEKDLYELEEENEYINVWIDYVKEYILEIKNNG